MWVKLTDQTINKGDLLAKEVAKDELENKELISGYFVKEINGENYELENFIEQPESFVAPEFDLTSELAIPVEFSMTYDDLIKGDWYIWEE